MDEATETRAAAYREHPLQAEVARLTQERDAAKAECDDAALEAMRLRQNYVDMRAAFHAEVTSLRWTCVVVTVIFMFLAVALGRWSR